MASNASEKARALQQCESDLDLVIARLTNLGLDPAPAVGSSTDAHPANAAAAEAESAALPPFPPCGSRAEWAEVLFDRMSGAADAGDAKARAAALLEAFERSVAADLKVAAWQNGVLKKAVLVQHRLHKAQEEANRELRCQVAACQERARKLEADNYALSVHLRRAQQSSMPGRFHPEVF
ncbi:hypothetical protein EJB05_16383, partial [Eragrostis curvula]